MAINLLPEIIRDNYEIYEWKHASAIFQGDFPSEYQDIIDLLTDFRLKKSWITNPGGRKPKVSEFNDNYLYRRGWREKNFKTQVVIDQSIIESPTHKVDCYKNRVALEIE